MLEPRVLHKIIDACYNVFKQIQQLIQKLKRGKNNCHMQSYQFESLNEENASQ